MVNYYLGIENSRKVWFVKSEVVKLLAAKLRTLEAYNLSKSIRRD
jgi:hypothetical protein